MIKIDALIYGVIESPIIENFLRAPPENISNAFENVPFADQVFGLLGSVPAEMLNVSGTGLLKHMFGCLDGLIGGTKSKKNLIDIFAKSKIFHNSKPFSVNGLFSILYAKGGKFEGTSKVIGIFSYSSASSEEQLVKKTNADNLNCHLEIFVLNSKQIS